MGKWTGVLNDRPAQTIAEIRSTMRQSMKQYPSQSHLIVIDYLQLIQPIGHFERHDLAIGEITKQLKILQKNTMSQLFSYRSSIVEWSHAPINGQ
jgi:replicative DNA helicase